MSSVIRFDETPYHLNPVELAVILGIEHDMKPVLFRLLLQPRLLLQKIRFLGQDVPTAAVPSIVFALLVDAKATDFLQFVATEAQVLVPTLHEDGPHTLLHPFVVLHALRYPDIIPIRVLCPIPTITHGLDVLPTIAQVEGRRIQTVGRSCAVGHRVVKAFVDIRVGVQLLDEVGAIVELLDKILVGEPALAALSGVKHDVRLHQLAVDKSIVLL